MFGKASLLWDDEVDRPADISRIMQAVESLPSDDQVRLLRLIELLAAMPETTHFSSARQVLQLLSGFRLLSRQECRYRVDTAIACLESEREEELEMDFEDAAFETH